MSNSRVKDRTGERRKNNSGEYMTIIKYVNARDIDIQFDDGTILYHRQYIVFKDGRVQNPNSNTSNEQIRNMYADERIGEKNCATNGQMMEIIAYRKSSDIDVRFEDGNIVRHVRYGNFKMGKIDNPKYSVHKTDSLNEFAILFYLKHYGFIKGRAGKMKKYGLGRREIDIYNPQRKIGIEYDGENWHKEQLERDKTKDNLCKELGITMIRIREPNLPKIHSDYVFESNSTIQLNDSLEKIIKKIGELLNLDLDVSFSRDKEEIYKKYNSSYKKNFIGETNIANNGLLMEIIAYRNAKDIDIKFENDIIVEHKNYAEFKKGNIGCPTVNIKPKRRKTSRVGETNISKDGYKMKIIKYRLANDIDVLFEDTGIIAKHRSYNNFLNGAIAMREIADECLSNRIGEVQRNNLGEKMTIIAYRNATDLDVRFEDGTIVTNRTYFAFEKGKIKNPNYMYRKHFGRTNISNSGHKMIIIGFRSYNDIDIQFDTGDIVYHRSLKEFNNGHVALPKNKGYP